MGVADKIIDLTIKPRIFTEIQQLRCERMGKKKINFGKIYDVRASLLLLLTDAIIIADTERCCENNLLQG